MKSQPVNKCLILIFSALLFSTSAMAKMKVERVEPPNWWVGMAEEHVELLIYGEELQGSECTVDYAGVLVEKVTEVMNTNYLFVTLVITDQASAGKIGITLTNGRKKVTFSYELKEHSEIADGARGIDQSDFIYLIFPDRFANGDESNDLWNESKEPVLDRSHIFKRHGGDLQGIIDHLDYVDELGVTALWLNPVWTNDQPKTSYHGYAPTDIYHIDPRFGGDLAYAEFVKKSHSKGIKVIKDIVYNHWGDEHWIFRDLPDSSWFNFWPEFTKTSFRAPTLLDPYADPAETRLMSDGWFDHHMPDLNQRNPQLANYLIQNSVWWVAEYGIDAFRIDTYAYPDQLFMKELAERMKIEFPDFTMFGETWVHGLPVQAWFTEENGVAKDFNSKLDGVTDFQLYFALTQALNQNYGWTEGASKLYYTLAQDGVYAHPENQVTFLDNHDLSRIYSVLGEDPLKMKLALGFILTTRGIPSLYYGTEICLGNFADPDGKVRQDFPGGWKTDSLNKFMETGRKGEEADVFRFVKQLAGYRRNNPSIFMGSLTQYIPQNGVYSFLRSGDDKKLLVVMNLENDSRTFHFDNLVSLKGLTTGIDIPTKKKWDLSAGEIAIEPKTILILEVQ